MKTDIIFYRLFQEFPDIFFELTAPTAVMRYSSSN
ncbi:DUF2887 domain-containing protein [Nostoc sp. CALU 546]